MTRLKFGKHKGEDIQTVPSEYLRFLVGSAQETISECEAELNRRELAGQAEMPWIRRVIETGYRELGRKHHPDLGNGDVEDMRELNAAVEKLRELVRQG